MRSVIKKIATLLVTVVFTAALILGGIWLFQENFVTVDGRFLWRHSRSVDLSGHDLEDLYFLHEFTRLQTIDARGCELSAQRYGWLRQEFPHSRILWDVPFQGRHYSMDTQKLVLTRLSDADLEMLGYLPELKSVDGWDCPDYDNLLKLQQRRPHCKVFYAVPISGKLWDCDITELHLADVDLQELKQNLKYLPRVHTIHLSGELPHMEQLQKILKQYPKVALSWQVDIGEAVLELGATSLDLSGFSQIDGTQVEKWIPYLPGLREVKLFDCGIPAGELMALAQQYPDIQFLFDVPVGPVTVRSDVRELDLSGHAIESTELVEAVLPCFRNLERVVMCGCGIPSGEMDALGKRYPDIRFVWSVNLGGLEVRTDAKYFIPTKYDVDVTSRDLQELRYCVDMVGVDVGHMRGVTNCEWAAYMPNLKYLVLADTRVSDISPLAGLEKLVFVELFLTGVRDYSPLLECPALEDLNLCYTYGNPEPVTQITWLKRLWWAGNWTAKVRYGEAFAENIPGCTFNFDTESSTGEGWREGRNYYAMRDLFGMSYMTW